MKLFIKIPLTLLVMQVLTTQAIPMADRTSATGPTHDIIYDFLLEKFHDIKSSVALEFAATHRELFQDSFAVLESKKDSGDDTFNAQFFTDLKRDMAQFEQSIENLKKDKNNCELQQDVSHQIEDLRQSTRDHLRNDDIIELWRRREKEDSDFQAEKYKTTFAEIKKQLPEIISKYTSGLSAADRQEFEAILSGEPNTFAALSSIYQPIKNAALAEGIDSYCKNIGIKLVAGNLEVMAKGWMLN